MPSKPPTMCKFIQYSIFIFETTIVKFFNIIFNAKTYKRIGVFANPDLDDNSKQLLKQHLKKYHYSRPMGPQKSICYAPTKSIYFGLKGKVVSCCFNREFVYGNYPDDSVNNLISSKQRHLLQEALNEHDFSKGCQHCRRQILSGNYQGVEARLYDKLKSNPKFPSEIIFELDNSCNLECIMCNGEFSSSISNNREHNNPIKSPYNKEFEIEIAPYLKHLQVAKFLGGEPFLISSYYRIWEELILVNPSCFINLQTNGTIYNDKIESLLKRGRFQIGISIDSLKKERFEFIRKNANFEQVLENTDKFIKYTKKSGSFVNISVCPMQMNWDEIPEIVNFCIEKNVFIYFNTVYTEGFSLQEFSSEKLNEIIEFYKKSNIYGNGYISKRNKKIFYNFITQVEQWCQLKYETEIKSIRRWEYTHEDLLNIFQEKLGSNYIPHQPKLTSAVNSLPDIIIINDIQKNSLNGLSTKDLLNALNTESVELIAKRLSHFVHHSHFSL